MLSLSSAPKVAPYPFRPSDNYLNFHHRTAQGQIHCLIQLIGPHLCNRSSGLHCQLHLEQPINTQTELFLLQWPSTLRNYYHFYILFKKYITNKPFPPWNCTLSFYVKSATRADKEQAIFKTRTQTILPASPGRAAWSWTAVSALCCVWKTHTLDLKTSPASIHIHNLGGLPSVLLSKLFIPHWHMIHWNF